MIRNIIIFSNIPTCAFLQVTSPDDIIERKNEHTFSDSAINLPYAYVSYNRKAKSVGDFHKLYKFLIHVLI